MASMVKLFVNGEEVEVESGKNLIDAIAAIGIEIPHFCYHPALGADGNCRMCLVGIEDGRPPLVPACKTPAVEGMRVQLDVNTIKKIRRDVLEFQLVNHPIDCPVCDQAGECSLQDYYMRYDCQSSRMRVDRVKKGKKMDFGCGVVHDQERCVLCGRCVRFCRQVTGTGELGIVNRGDSARVAPFPSRLLDNKYALNIVDLCPVGAMTSADFRFKQRAWFLNKDEGICHGCSKGCNIYVDHNREKYKDDVIYRFRARFNEQVNGHFICDTGRLSYKGENENRLKEALRKGKPLPLSEVVEQAKKVIGKASKSLVLLSPNLSLEQMIAAQCFAESIGAALSGYSDDYISPGDGDDFLIQEDKSANRGAFEMLGVDTAKAAFMENLEKAEVLINIGNRSFNTTESKVKKAISNTTIIMFACHISELTEQADFTLPQASYSEYSGIVVNCDGVLQFFRQAVRKNNPPHDTVMLLHLLGGPIVDREESLTQLAQRQGVLANVDVRQIPQQGLKLSLS